MSTKSAHQEVRILGDKRSYVLASDGTVWDISEKLWDTIEAALSDTEFDFPGSVPPQLVLVDYSHPHLGRVASDAILAATDFAEDLLTNDLSEIEGGYPEDTWISSVFPPKYRLALTPQLVSKFLSILDSVGARLSGSAMPFTSSCIAEELLADWIVNELVDDEHLRKRGVDDIDVRSYNEDLGIRLETFCQDGDYTLLYDPGLDGIDKTEIARKMGMRSLSVDHWFDE